MDQVNTPAATTTTTTINALPVDQVNTTTAATTTTINALPVELLLRVFHALPWHDRVRGVEGVCRHWHQLMRAHGWDDVRHFDEQQSPFIKPWWKRIATDADHSPWRGPFLSRIGPRLVSLELSGGSGEIMKPVEQRCQVLLADLAKCPVVRHLGLSYKLLDLPIITYIASVYAPTLKSLRLESCWPTFAEDYPRRDEASEVAYISAFSDKLGSFTALEYLRLILRGEWLSGLRFPASLTNLCCLELDCRMDEGQTSGVLSEANVRVLASLPALSSLALHSDCKSGASFAFLRHFTRLEYISLSLDRSNVEGFVEALPHLAPRLRALEVILEEDRPIYMLAGDTMPHIIPAIVAHLTKLEHLQLHTYEESKEFGPELLKCLRPLGYSPPLRSLDIGVHHPRFSKRAVAVDWTWLEGVRHLEYLALSKAPPMATICAIIEKCKGLRYLAPGDQYSPTAEEQAQLIAAAAEKTYTTSVDSANDGAGYEVGDQVATLPIPLLVKVKKGSTLDNAAAAAGSRSSSRLRFVEKEVSSPVADRYAFGCLSEGKPRLRLWRC